MSTNGEPESTANQALGLNTYLASKIWARYAWARDNGHSQYVEKADRCDRFFRGDQWDPEDRAKLMAVRRPALTINKILPTIANIVGEQISNRCETSFRPRSGAPGETADVLTKVMKQISDANQLAWKRSDMFTDGVITGRGFLDARIGYGNSMRGDVIIENVNPKNIIIDPDGEEYDPDSWSEVYTTKWVTADDIAILYSEKYAKMLRNRDQSYFPYGYDSIEAFRDRFGDRFNPAYQSDYDNSNVLRNIRLIDRQSRELDRQKHFLSPQTGDMRPIPEEFDRDRIAMFVQQFGFKVVTKLVRRIRWTVIADAIVLHNDWSPYKHFTVVPYFPHFRRGTTIGLVENLLSPQELLNKVSSQELHVVNTTANSGWKVKAGTLTNMTLEELEEKGAQTGIVLEVNGDPDKDIQKIQPNQVPQGLDRISSKAEEAVKSISGVSDSMQGFDREDVAAKAIQEKKKSGSTNLVKPLDNLTRTDFILARNILDMVQEFYTEERVMTITHDQATGETQNFSVNQVSPDGQVINDLSIGEYDVVVTSVPARESMEDSQFDQAMAMKEAGIQIPDSVILDSSRLINKRQIIQQMEGNKDSPEAKAQAALTLRGQQASVSKLEGEAASKHADAQLKGAKTQKESIQAHILATTPPEADDSALEATKFQHEAGMKELEFKRDSQLKMMDFQMEKEKMDAELQLKAEDLRQKREDQRVAQAQQAAAAAQKQGVKA